MVGDTTVLRQVENGRWSGRSYGAADVEFPSAEDRLMDLIQAMSFHRSSLDLMICPKGGIGPTVMGQCRTAVRCEAERKDCSDQGHLHDRSSLRAHGRLLDFHIAEITIILKRSLIHLRLVVSSGLVVSVVGVILAAPQHIRDDIAQKQAPR